MVWRQVCWCWYSRGSRCTVTTNLTHCQGCINRSSLPAGLGARGVSSEHVENMENAEKMENMEMFSGSPLRCSSVLQLRCALILRELNQIFIIHCMFCLGEVKNNLSSFKHSYLRHFS